MAKNSTEYIHEHDDGVDPYAGKRANENVGKEGDN